jgi:hypothetical protein
MWPPESGLLSLGRSGGVGNDDGRHLPALPIFAGVLSTGKSFQVVFRALATVGWLTADLFRGSDQRMVIRCFRDDLAVFVYDISHVPPPSNAPV